MAGKGKWRRRAALGLTQAGAALLAAAAVGGCLWLLALNLPLLGIFRGLAGEWIWGPGGFDGAALAWMLAASAVFGVLGWFLLECFEVYLPRLAAAALAWIFGLGLAGFAFECLAIPYALSRRSVALALGGLLALLALGAWWRAGRAPESGLGGEAGPGPRALRRRLAREAHERAIIRPASLAARVFRSLALTLIGLITLAIFWHALLYPAVYWDSLILYLGYARQTFLAHGFPVKITGQVGIGLGANYPHLYAVVGAGVATAMGRWSEVPQQLIAPVCGLATTVLVYHAALRLTRHTNAALAIALLYRATPLAIAYDTYASDYALALLFGAALLYLTLRAIESGLSGYLALGALLVALAMHLNYLMGILWLPWGLAAWLAHAGWPAAGEGGPPLGADPDAPWTARRRLGGLGLFGAGWLWGWLAVAGAIGATWYLRNWLVTGNPVYAFFYDSLFPGTKHVNPAVMAAAAREWEANGAGIGGFTRSITHGAAEAFAAQPPANFAESFLNPTVNGIAARLRLLPEFLVGSPRWRQGYRLMPLVGGFAAGGGVVWLARWLASPLAGRGRSAHARAEVRFGLVVATLAAALLAFHVVLAPFYLYQIIPLIPCLALIAALAWPLWSRRPWRWVLGGLALWTGLVPGLAMALMGFKVPGAVQIDGSGGISPLSLYVLRHPLPPRDVFYQWRYGDDAKMWDYVNTHLKGEKLLTHENRDLALDPSITIVNLDDWDIQPLWQIKDPSERVRRLVDDFDIHYYLYIPNEDATATNALMGAKAWAGEGLAKLIYETQDPPDKLYELTPRGDDQPTTPTETDK